jgi:hypothetical protein
MGVFKILISGVFPFLPAIIYHLSIPVLYGKIPSNKDNNPE